MNNILNINIMGLLAVIVLLITISAVVYECYTVYKFFAEVIKSKEKDAPTEERHGGDVAEKTSTE